MNSETVTPDDSTSLFVKNILVFEEADNSLKTVLPFFADGFPGLIFQETENGLLVSPHNKRMPSFFLYGQTINPIELIITGQYKLIIVQLYPFVLKSFFNVIPQDLTDNCYNLELLQNDLGTETNKKLQQTKSTADRIKLITFFLQSLFQAKQKELDLTVSQAIKKIIAKKGQLLITTLCNELHITERTFERRFFSEVGVTAKQFARIIQFQQSLEQLTVKDYTKLSDIVYANGFADQSHFIKVFKVFTGKTPLAFTVRK